MNAQSVSYTGDGNTAVYLFPFLIEESLDLEVLVNSVTQTSGYAILGGEGANIGGAVRFGIAPGNGSAIILRRTGKVQVSPTDAPGFLDAKLAAGNNVTITPSSDASGQHLVIAANIDTSAFLSKSQNLADLPNTAAARANLGLASVAASGSYTDLINKPTLGSAAAHAATDFATAVQGAKADSSLQSSDIGNSIQAHDADLDWIAANLSSAGKALMDDADASAQRATLGLATVAASGSYADLSNKPGLGNAAALNVDTDVTLAANSDSLLPSQKAVKAYADAKAASILSSTSFSSLEQDQALTALLSTMAGGWGAGTLSNGAYDAFNSDTIGGNSSNQAYSAGSKLYENQVGYALVSPSAGTIISTGTTALGPYNLAAAFDGSAIGVYNAATSCYTGAPFSASLYQLCVGKDYGAGNAHAVTRCRLYSSTDQGLWWGHIGSDLTIAVDCSDDGASWAEAATQAITNATGTIYTLTWPSAGAHRYWRLRIVVADGSQNISCPEMDFSTANSAPNMALVSNALNPAPTTAPAKVKILVLHKAIDASTLNTDFTAEASRDGSTWTAGTLSDTGLTVNGFKVLWAAVDVSAQPSGTTVKYRLKTLNAKAQQVKGVAVITA